jgi:isoquinoline 1-oxidoreductase alpha subunit
MRTKMAQAQVDWQPQAIGLQRPPGATAAPPGEVTGSALDFMQKLCRIRQSIAHEGDWQASWSRSMFGRAHAAAREPPMKLNVNGADHEIDATPDMPLLWVLRDLMGLTGTKFGCGIAQCGACTVHVDGAPLRACVTPVQAVAGKTITTIEGLSADGSHPVQKAWAELDVVQCGYCQSGQIMSAVALLAKLPTPTDTDIDQALAGNLCRCGTYQRIRAAVHRAAEIGKA